MDYYTFYKRFGGSVRTKNIGRVEYELPRTSEIPTEFIRMCPWEVEYLYTVANRVELGAIETGRYKGGSTFVLACAIPKAPILSIDIAPHNDDTLRALFAQHKIGKNVTLLVADSQKVNYDRVAVDLVFIDGDHSYEGCLNDLKNWYKYLSLNGHLLVHDSHINSKYGVQKAVIDFMEEHPELQVVSSPFIGMHYWNWPAGSLAHFIRRG